MLRQDIATGSREVPLVMFQDAPAVSFRLATQVEQLVYLQGQEEAMTRGMELEREKQEKGLSLP